ncbi:uncharacterized protein N7483_009967 [Penicillium malachiteum]|uniref:uncharacterized protein n=1 Tax=Penicillium malachiteum TaxID=1324776 RepID=UPI002547100E|nr:uncharacterized protein N7483_009967 [Penicillium malachiteum]KAJ5718885.1 hypothetical protein N7483_009967 [Penicillium malachiteum]
MKFMLVVFFALLALVAAENTTAEAPATTVVISPEAQCAKNCNNKDVCCIAKCYHVPCPSNSQANDTNKCVAACPQGTGTPADTKKYEDCEQSCYASHFFPADVSSTTSSTHSETTMTGTHTTESGTHASETHAGATQSGTQTAMVTTASGSKTTNEESKTSGSATSSEAKHTTNAATNLQTGASGAGLLALVFAAFVL